MVATPAAVSRLPDGGRFVALDSWRGIAALGVAVRHINGPGPLVSGPLHENLSMAVDFFFVLSGFVIAAAYGERLRAGFSTLRFMLLRYGRVWPVHALIVALYVLLEVAYALWGAGPLSGRPPFTEVRDPTALVPTMLLLQAFAYPSRELWVAQSWSISVEIGLYFAAALAWRFAGKGTVLLAALSALAAMLVLDAEMGGRAYYILRGVAGFGLGLVGWSLWCRIDGASLPSWLVSALELSALPAVLLAIRFQAPYLVADLLFLGVVILFAFEKGPVSRLFRTVPLVLLGTLSYSLFLVHGFVYGRIFDALAFAQDRLGTRWVSSEIGGFATLQMGPVASTLVALAMLMTALACAWPVWRLVEWPARDWSRRQARRMGVEREELQAPTV